MSIETCLRSWCPPSSQDGTSAIGKLQADWRSEPELWGSFRLWSVGRSCYSFLSGDCWPEFHGFANHTYPPCAEAGSCRRGLEQPGALQGIQTAVVSGRTHVPAESLPRTMHCASHHDRRLDSSVGQELPRRRS